jgi:hypothetical protein
MPTQQAYKSSTTRSFQREPISSALSWATHRSQSGGDHALVGPGHPLQQVAGKVHPAALPDAALQLAADGLGEPGVGVRVRRRLDRRDCATT